MSEHKSLPKLYVWMGDVRVPYDSLSDSDKEKLKDRVTAIWQEATLRHIESLKRQYGIGKKARQDA